MFDIAWSELAVIAVVALVVIGPKDLPRVLATVGMWVRKARSIASDFQGQIEQMARDAELDEMKKKIEATANDLTTEVSKIGEDPKPDEAAPLTDVERTLADPNAIIVPEALPEPTPPVTAYDPMMPDSMQGSAPPVEVPPPAEAITEEPAPKKRTRKKAEPEAVAEAAPAADAAPEEAPAPKKPRARKPKADDQASLLDAPAPESEKS